MASSCEPCPCYTTPTASFPVIVPWQSGKCESTITIPFLDGQFLSAWSGAKAQASTPEDQAALDVILSEYQSALKPFKSSVHNATKTAISTIYAGYIFGWGAAAEQAIPPTPAQIAAGRAGVKRYVDVFICWILRQKAYEGPCAYAMMSTAALFSSLSTTQPAIIIFSAYVSENQVMLDQLVAALNKSSEIVLKNHNCCSLTPLNLPTFSVTRK